MALLFLLSGTALAYGGGPPPTSTTTTSTSTTVPMTTTTAAVIGNNVTTTVPAVAGLAFTGSDVAESVAIALSLIAVGAIVRIAGRRRQT